ncbi:hypothetical protein KAX17_12490 [Candidatus Bipolaricaulota bacterium]|nr:hypothetical protein [Candidatus Bipolaricaulota bacterium]
MNKDELFDLCAYIAVSAQGLKDEPKDYGPLRLLEVLRRLAMLTAAEYRDAFLREIAEELNEKQDLVMTDKEAFYRFLEQLIIKITKEAKRRMT